MPIDADALRPQFAWLPVETIRRTFDATTQYYRMPASTYLKKAYKSPFPALNIHRRGEPLGTDTVYADTPAIASGATSAQFFVGTDTLVADIYGMKTDKQFVNTLLDNIRTRGAPTKLISDRAQLQTSNKVKDILRYYMVGDWQSEPYHQNQNPAERHYQNIKRMANVLLDRTGAPASYWLFAMQHACFIHNHVALQRLGWVTPIAALTGSTPDISPLLEFEFYEPVYYKLQEPGFPSESCEGLARFAGIAENVGHAMTFKLITDDTRHLIMRSEIRTARDPASLNRRLPLPLPDARPTIIDTPQHDAPIVETLADKTNFQGAFSQKRAGRIIQYLAFKRDTAFVFCRARGIKYRWSNVPR